MSVGNTPDDWDQRSQLEDPHAAVMWSEASQATRFWRARQLLRDRLHHGDSVFDFGCGTGAFADWIAGAPSYEYVGYDWSPGMRDRARADHPGVIILDDLADDPVFDHVVCIGPFNLRDHWSKTKTAMQLKQLWKRSEKQMIVSLYRGPESSVMLSYDLHDVARVSAMLRCDKLTIVTEHLPNDLLVRWAR